ncbi:unnamed protein product [Haemonchus placei]|uniref:Autophagy-related protein 9 n=1 Tax=Haemonchus placei TaxID=6290 RepID=A0A0N4X3G8_HAEPC|nr:unnamed protein product [Haemonchus placei]
MSIACSQRTACLYVIAELWCCPGLNQLSRNYFVPPNSFLHSRTLDLLSYVRLNVLAIFTAVVISILLMTLFNKIISPYFHEYYKRLLFYDDALQHLKDVLEMDYDVLWNQPEFCLAFLKAYQTFLAVARSDSSGRISKVSRYNKYTVIDMH